MEEKIRGYGWRPVRKCDMNDYRYVHGKVRSGLFSRVEIKNHMEKYNVELSCCRLQDPAEFEGFSDYISREFAEGARPVDGGENALVSPCDGYLTAHFINSFAMIPIESHMYSIEKLLGGDSRGKEFAGGLALMIRLDEADPHRFAYPDSGLNCDSRLISAEKNTEDSMFFGPRYCSLLQTKHFFNMAQVELCGNAKGIEQFDEGADTIFEKGQPKGKFLCEGAAVMLLFKKGMMFPDDEFMVNTRMGLETRVLMGEKIGVAIAL